MRSKVDAVTIMNNVSMAAEDLVCRWLWDD